MCWSPMGATGAIGAVMARTFMTPFDGGNDHSSGSGYNGPTHIGDMERSYIGGGSPPDTQLASTTSASGHRRDSQARKIHSPTAPPKAARRDATLAFRAHVAHHQLIARSEADENSTVHPRHHQRPSFRAQRSYAGHSFRC